MGVPGTPIHRVPNTPSAMVGHRNQRYRRSGTVSARADDVATWVPTRLTGASACVRAPLVGGDVPRAWRIMRCDGARHPSPNGGQCESAWVGTLGVWLGGESHYGDRVKFRLILGDDPRPIGLQAYRVVKLATAVTAAATGLLAGALIVFGGGRK